MAVAKATHLKARETARQRAEREGRMQVMQLALKALRAGEVASIRKAAILFDVNRCTLTNRFNGRHGPTTEAHAHEQRLSLEEEDSVIKAVSQLDAWGWPISIDAIRNLAAQLLLAKGDDRPLGQKWPWNFLSRHDDLRMRRLRAMDQNRKDAMDYDTGQQWFELFQNTRLQHGVADSDIYNMDEKRCMKGIGQGHNGIVPRSAAEAFVA